MSLPPLCRERDVAQALAGGVVQRKPHRAGANFIHHNKEVTLTTTKTKPKTDPFSELAAIEEQLEAAREERSRLGQEHRASKDEIGRLQAELDGLAASDPGQFEGGQPKPTTRAGEVEAEITKRVTGNRWAQILQASDQRIRVLVDEHSRTTEANAEGLARAEFQARGRAAVEKLRKAAVLILEAGDEYTASWSAQMEIVNTVTGLSGQDVVSDPFVAEARKLAERLVDVQPPRAVSLVPMISDDPPRVRSVNGGFIRAGSNAADIAEVQPQRVERV